MSMTWTSAFGRGCGVLLDAIVRWLALAFLAAGAFATAGLIYVFQRKDLYSIGRSAVLMGLLSYSFVTVTLLADLGLPWHFWQLGVQAPKHSAMFEVSWCVGLYVTILAFEFLPVPFERWNLGGAMEAALAFDFIIAEENAVFGLPEVAFNTFPGMGAVTLLTRRVGPALTERIISSGETYSGRRMFDLGVIDRCAPPDGARAAALDWMREDGDAKWRRRRTPAEARRRSYPITHEELVRITELWAETSARIEERDLRHMERLVRAQQRLIRQAQKASKQEDGV